MNTERFSPVVSRVGGQGSEGWALLWAARKAQAAGREVINLSLGDPDFDTPTGIVDRAIDALRSGDTHYPDISGRPALRRAVADAVNRRSGTVWNAENVIACMGTQGAMFGAALCLLGPGDEVVVPDPAYLTYEATLRVGGAALVPVPLGEGTFALDVGAIERALTPQTKAVVLNTPSNPTGVVAAASDLAALADVLRDRRASGHEIWVMADEVYADLVFEGEHHSIGVHHDLADQTVLFGGLSKSHAMTGWRIGWATGPVDLMASMGKLSLAMTYGLPGFVQEAGVVAIEQNAAAVAEMRAAYVRRRDLVMRGLADARGVQVVKPKGGMFVLADVGGTGLSSHDFAWRLFEDTGVAVLDAANFGSRADGFIRISFTIGDDELTDACARITTFANTLPSATNS
jgi:arginine:pyruvate transaminase